MEKGVTDWLGTHRANITGTITVFDAIRRQGARIPVVYASSAAVYGDCRHRSDRRTEPCAPLSAYGADKYGCELHARVASRVHAIPTTGLRLFNVYGPRQDPKSPYSGVISIFCERIAAGAPIKIFGDGQQTRDFVYVTDVVAALLAAMALRSADPPVFNICTGVPTTVESPARLIAGLAGKTLDTHTKPRRTGEIRHSLGVPTRAHTVLGLRGCVPLRTGLGQVLAWVTGSAGLIDR